MCTEPIKKNGTTRAGTPRWRCTNPHCGSSISRRRTDKARTRDVRTFHTYVTGTTSLSDIARQHGVSRWTLTRRFRTFWLIDIPNQPDPDRIYDQIFIDGTYTQAGCLLVAASLDHVSPGTGHPPNQHRPTHNY